MSTKDIESPIKNPPTSLVRLVFLVTGAVMFPLAVASILSDLRHDQPIDLSALFLALGLGFIGLGHKKRQSNRIADELKDLWSAIGLTMIGMAMGFTLASLIGGP